MLNDFINKYELCIDISIPKPICHFFCQIDQYFVAAGLKNGASNASLGVAQLMARWIIDGSPPCDAYELEVSRFLPAHNNHKFLRDRVTEVPGEAVLMKLTQ